uniref:Uncharacterized protein n=1 Tax=Elaeophora elaphi TaxID=1147741 RepID=A0A0R3RSB7_9BILA
MRFIPVTSIPLYKQQAQSHAPVCQPSYPSDLLIFLVIVSLLSKLSAISSCK